MSKTQRKTSGRTEMDTYASTLNYLVIVAAWAVLETPSIGDGTTNGFARTTAAVDYKNQGLRLNKASTDDFWDLTGEPAVSAGKFRAYWLMIDNVAAGAIIAGPERDTQLEALQALPVPDVAVILQSVAGTYVANPGTDFTAPLSGAGVFTNGVLNSQLLGPVNGNTIDLVAP